MWKEFKDFALQGNLVDIAVAFVMGGAFGKIVTSFTDGIVSPLIGLLMGGVNLSEMKFILREGTAAVTDASGAVTTPAVAELAIQWGAFIATGIDFLIVAFVMFLVIKAMNNLKKKQQEAPAAPAADISLLTEIRDLLKK